MRWDGGVCIGCTKRLTRSQTLNARNAKTLIAYEKEILVFEEERKVYGKWSFQAKNESKSNLTFIAEFRLLSAHKQKRT